MPASGLAGWRERYDAAGIDRGSPPPDEVRAMVARAGCVVTSDLPRAIASARAAGARATEIWQDLREAGLPTPRWPALRLAARTWCALARVGWFLGWAPDGCEDPRAVQRRATGASLALAALAERAGIVVVIGHAVFNGFLARALRRKGYVGPRWPGARHWSLATYLGPVVQRG